MWQIQWYQTPRLQRQGHSSDPPMYFGPVVPVLGEAENASGIWNIEHTSTVMKVVLSYTYTGIVDQELMKQDSMAILAAANEFQIKSLQDMAFQARKHTLGVENLKETLTAGHLFGIGELKQACFDFVQENLTDALTYRNFASLAAEDPELWDELTAVILGDKKKASKRPRVG